MPFPLFAIAIPVLHSSGAWIASTAAGGYVAGTLSSTWIGAFILGNSSLLSGLGLVSAAGTGGAALGMSGALSAVGLGSVAPAATFLGLTPAGWAIAGGAGALAVTLGSYFTLKIMRKLNKEREKGGLEPVTLLQILEEVEIFETKSMKDILERLEKETNNLSLSDDRESVAIDGQTYPVAQLKYIMNEDGSEEIRYVARIGRDSPILQIKGANEVEAIPSHQGDLTPGNFIRDAVLKAHGLDEASAAERLGVDLTEFCDLLDGQSAISPEMALRLEEEFGLSLDMLLHMQAVYSAAQMRRRRREGGLDS